MTPELISLLVGISVCFVGVAGYVGFRLLMRSYSESSENDQRVNKKYQPKSNLALLFRQAGYRRSVISLYLFMGVLAALIICAFSVFNAPLYISVPIAFIISVGGPVLYLRMRRAARLILFVQQLPNALDLIASGLRVGLGVNSTCQVVGEEMSEPIGWEFSQLVAEMDMGATLDQSLRHMMERNMSTDVRLFAQSVMINKKVGGNLSEVLDNLSQTIRDRFWLQRELSSATVQNRITAWVVSLFPLVMAGVLLTIDRGYFEPLINVDIGWYVLGAGFLLQALGIVTLINILRIDF